MSAREGGLGEALLPVRSRLLAGLEVAKCCYGGMEAAGVCYPLLWGGRIQLSTSPVHIRTWSGKRRLCLDPLCTSVRTGVSTVWAFSFVQLFPCADAPPANGQARQCSLLERLWDSTRVDLPPHQSLERLL